MPLSGAVVESVTGGLEAAYNEGIAAGESSSRQQFFGGAAAVLTARLFSAALSEAAAVLREYSPGAADFFAAKADEFDAFVSPPQVQAHDPLDGATGVSVDTLVNVQFVGEIRSDSLDDDTFYVGADAGGPHLGGEITWSASERTATFTPTNSLSPDTLYRVTLHNALAAGGMPLDPEYTFTFTTEAA